MRKLLVLPKALAVTLFACGSPHPLNDGGTDAGRDGGQDGGTMDGGEDAGFDAGTDAGFDGGSDAGSDGGSDTRCLAPCVPYQDPDGGVVCQCPG